MRSYDVLLCETDFSSTVILDLFYSYDDELNIR